MPSSQPPIVCIFICKSNSARSIVAECVARSRFKELCPSYATCDCSIPLEFFSAGVAASDARAIKTGVIGALGRAGYSLEGLRSKAISDLLLELQERRVGYVVTLCCEAEVVLRSNPSLQASLTQRAAPVIGLNHISVQLVGPAEACRKAGLAEDAKEGEVHYDELVVSAEKFIARLPDLLRGATPLVPSAPSPDAAPA